MEEGRKAKDEGRRMKGEWGVCTAVPGWGVLGLWGAGNEWVKYD